MTNDVFAAWRPKPSESEDAFAAWRAPEDVKPTRSMGKSALRHAGRLGRAAATGIGSGHGSVELRRLVRASRVGLGPAPTLDALAVVGAKEAPGLVLPKIRPRPVHLNSARSTGHGGSESRTWHRKTFYTEMVTYA